MLKVMRAGQAGLEAAPDPIADWRLPQDTIWIDLDRPTRSEELLVEQELGVGLPTREEMAEIEPSSRLYQEDGATIMTATVLCGSQTTAPTNEPVTFVLARETLVTIRYAEPRALKIWLAQAEKQGLVCESGRTVLMNLLDAFVDRLADVLEHTGQEVETLSQGVFERPRVRSFEALLTGLGLAQNVTAKARESLVSQTRLIGFALLSTQVDSSSDAREHLKTLARDVQSLTDHSSYLSGNIQFLLDAALGLINIEQNGIIKIFSVMAVVFMPPTLIASIYGMNFHHMPELDKPWAYPIALAAMVLSAVLPIWLFHRKGWLK